MKARSFAEPDLSDRDPIKVGVAGIAEVVFVAVLLIITVGMSLRMLVQLVVALFS